MRIKKGSTDISVYFHLRDSSDGTSKTGLVYNSAGAVASYVRNRGTRIAITLATLAAADSAHADGGFKEVDGTNTKGLYRLDLPDAALASGVDDVVIHIGFDGVFAESLRIDLVDNIEKDTYDKVNHATYGLEVNQRFVRNIAGFVKHGNGVSWVKGDAYYWDPDIGNDSNDGLTPETAKLTFAATLALTMPYCHDSVNLINSTGAPLVVDAIVDISKAKVHLIGDGNTTIKTTSTSAATVILSAKGTHIEGLNVETADTGNRNSIEITEDECEIHNVNIPYSRGAGISITDSNRCVLHRFSMINPGIGGNGHGVEITGASTLNTIHDFDICGAAADGINFNGAGVTNNLIATGGGTSRIHGSGAWGVREQGGADGNQIIGGANMLITNNTAGAWELGPNTVIQNVTQYARYSDLPANFVDQSITATTGLVDITQTAADKVWLSASRTLTSFGTLVADTVDAVWDELIAGHVTADTFGKTVGDILARIGAFAGSSDNTILGFLKALMRNDVSAPSGVEGTYNPVTHSNQAIRVRGDIAWVTGSISGSGANNFNITVKIDDEFGATLVGVGVQIMDLTSTTTLVLLGTNTDGFVNVRLDTGSYKMYLDGGAGYQTIGGDPITLIVSDDTDQEAYMSAFSPGAPVGLNTCRVTNWHKDASGVVEVGKIWYARVTAEPTEAGDYLISHKRQPSTASNSEGYNYLDLIQGTVYEIDYEGKKYPDITIPAESTKKLVDLLP